MLLVVIVISDHTVHLRLMTCKVTALRYCCTSLPNVKCCVRSWLTLTQRE